MTLTAGPLELLASRTYLVRRDFVAGSKFEAGEQLLFVRCEGYSRYDGTFVYLFRTTTGAQKSWNVPEDMCPEQVEDYLWLV
jgi:hypothetical protein